MIEATPNALATAVYKAAGVLILRLLLQSPDVHRSIRSWNIRNVDVLARCTVCTAQGSVPPNPSWHGAYGSSPLNDDA